VKLARYLLRETSSQYVLGVTAFCLLLSIDLLSVFARFLIEQHASLATVSRLLLFKLPWFLHLSLPVAVVFAVLLATGRLAKDSELKAAYALGTTPLHLLLPLVLFGVLVSGLTLFNNGFLEPLAEVSYQRLVDSFFYTKPPAAVQTNVSYQIPNVGVFFASRVRSDPEARQRAQLTGAFILLADGTSMTAKSGVWDSTKQIWRLEDAQVVPPGQSPERPGSITVDFKLATDPSATLAKSETLTLTALRQRLQSTARAGGNTRNLLFQFHRRIADAFSAAVFVLLAGTLGLHLSNRSVGFAWTIVLLVLFWASWTLAGNLFETTVLGAISAAWLTPALAIIAGFLLAGWRFAR